jgi:hypothetical protein
MKAKLFLRLLVCLTIINLGCSPKLSNSKSTDIKKSESKLHHIVLFNFKETAPIDTIEKAMYELFGSIKGVNDLSFNKNVSSRGNLDKGYKYSFYMTFESEFVRDSVFYTHPNYKKIGGIIGPHINEYLIYDYWILEKK